MRNKLMAMLFVGALAIALSVGAFAYRTASAASAETGALTTAGAARLGRGGGDGMRGGVADEYLAAALGITVDELQAAQQEAHQAALAQAVEAGLITQAQADELTADGAAHFGGRGMGWLGESDIDFDTLLAQALGITVEKLDAAREQAFAARLDQAVTDGDLTQEQADLMLGQHALYGSENYQSTMQSAYETAIEQAVADGVITQAQADLILANQGEGGWRGPMGGDHPQGFGGPRGHGNHGFGPRGQWDDGDASADPSTPPAQTATP